MKAIKRKKRVSPYMWVIECPNCGRYLASASEKSLLPSFAYCDCEIRHRQTQSDEDKENKYDRI